MSSSAACPRTPMKFILDQAESCDTTHSLQLVTCAHGARSHYTRALPICTSARQGPFHIAKVSASRHMILGKLVQRFHMVEAGAGPHQCASVGWFGCGPSGSSVHCTPPATFASQCGSVWLKKSANLV